MSLDDFLVNDYELEVKFPPINSEDVTRFNFFVTIEIGPHRWEVHRRQWICDAQLGLDRRPLCRTRIRSTAP